jgi:hypothetical protein
MKKLLKAKNSDSDNIIQLLIVYVLFPASIVLPFLLVEWLR